MLLTDDITSCTSVIACAMLSFPAASNISDSFPAMSPTMSAAAEALSPRFFSFASRVFSSPSSPFLKKSATESANALNGFLPSTSFFSLSYWSVKAFSFSGLLSSTFSSSGEKPSAATSFCVIVLVVFPLPSFITAVPFPSLAARR